MDASTVPLGYCECKQCKALLPHTTRYFFCSITNVLRKVCKKCSHGVNYGLRSEQKPPKERQCTVCRAIYPNASEFFYTARQRKDGEYIFRNQCKSCEVAANKHRVADWRLDNREQYLDHAKSWKKDHREVSNAWSRDYRKKNAKVALRRNISAQMAVSIRQQKRGRSWEQVLGYSLNELVEHLEALFYPKMTWGNYGEWHIDHIKPLAAFTFTSPDDEDFKQCWALSNLQPLWAVDNLRKGVQWLRLS